MAGQYELLQAIDAYDRILRHSAGLRDGHTDRRREAVQLRRQISKCIAEIGGLGDAFFKETSAHPMFRDEFTRMRSAIAYHQASWPIVGIEPHDPDYKESVGAVREANRKFISWVRSATAQQ